MNVLSDIFANQQRQTEPETPPGKILVVTSCTKAKNYPPGFSQKRQLTSEQLWDEEYKDRVNHDFGELEHYRVPARKLYQGQQHIQLMKGVEALRQAFGREVVDVKIISAGFGLVDEDQALPPYNATFADLPTSKIVEISQKLCIPEKINQVISGSYDCAFFLLGESYLFSLGLPFAQTPAFPCLFLSGPSSRKRVPRRTPYSFVRIGQDDSISFSYNLVALKGYLIKLFADQIIKPVPQTQALRSDVTKAERLQSFFNCPTQHNFLEIVSPFRHPGRVSTAQVKKLATQTPLFPSKIDHITKDPARNHHRPMRYFIPDWDDLVDPGYTFETDEGAPAKRKYHDEVYAHEIYATANYDGLLFSKGTIEDGPIKTALVREKRVHDFARFHKPIMGDCGAFSYVKEKKPPYHTPEILDYYERLGFDYGVSIDHLIIPAFSAEKKYRYDLTRRNARDFLELHREKGYTFIPIGVAQGWDAKTYKQAVMELLGWGYKYIALGGLARANTKDILEILKAVAPVLEADIDVHLFGVARDREGQEMQWFRDLGVTSFDSATYLRRAWMSENTNYFTEDGERYAALRISPVYPSSPRVRKLTSEGVATIEQLQKLEQEALQAVRAFDRGELDLETTLEILLEIDKLEEMKYDQHKLLYRKVLEDQPWKKCSCEICRALGVEVIIFRKNDRNRRRGFHNTHIFYKRFRKLIGP